MSRPTLTIALALTACLAVAGCGVDGAPQPPVTPGITVTGDAQIGIVSN